ncbi:MAG: alpha/beta fold hydrolase [Acidiferrobacterales bacterium]
MALYAETLGDGPSIVLVHGWGFDSGVWHEWAKDLARRFRVTRIDLPGYGGSRDVASDFSAATLAEQVLAQCEPPVIWVGWSLGGMIGLAAAGAGHPAIVGLGLIGATAKFSQDDDWQHGMQTEQLNQFMRELEEDARATLSRFASLQPGAGDGRRLLRRLRRALPTEVPTMQALRAGLQLLSQADLRAQVASIDIPVALVHGSDDQIVPIGAAQHLMAQLPRATLVAIEGGGHAPFLSHPLDCTAAVVATQTAL